MVRKSAFGCFWPFSMNSRSHALDSNETATRVAGSLGLEVSPTLTAALKLLSSSRTSEKFFTGFKASKTEPKASKFYCPLEDLLDLETYPTSNVCFCDRSGCFAARVREGSLHTGRMALGKAAVWASASPRGCARTSTGSSTCPSPSNWRVLRAYYPPNVAQNGCGRLSAHGRNRDLGRWAWGSHLNGGGSSSGRSRSADLCRPTD